MKRLETLEYQLGYYVGEFIFLRCLPTLSIDMLQSRKVIQVSIAEADEYHALEDKWHKTYDGSTGKTKTPNPNWDVMRAYGHMLMKKYLPQELKCFVPKIYYTADFRMADFKKGIRDSLWDCDVCYYNIEKDEDIVIDDSEEDWFTIIKLQLDV
jgi:hypothetical protein